MSRPYPGYDDASPLTPSSGTSQNPISYSANVNRQKTKKWVEAKAPDYGGDDWGDDYGDDDNEPASAPISKPTGLRQPGQAAASDSQFAGAKKTYGDLPSIPSESQPRSSTMAARVRQNSFGQDDERRAFSGGQTPQSAVPSQFVPQTAPPISYHEQPPALQVSTHPSVTGLRKPVQLSSPVSASAQPDVEPVSTTSSRYTDHTKPSSGPSPVSAVAERRRDFSPSVTQQQTRNSGASQSAVSETASTRFPPRKSSISSNPPDLSDVTGVRTSQEVQKPWAAAPRSASPSGSMRSPSAEKKALPFIRPADIYKRMEEERERERQSLDSSRPSLESSTSKAGPDRSVSPAVGHFQATVGRPGDRSASPARATLQSLRSESPGFMRGPGSDADQLSETGRRPVTLEPVKERRSEYGLENFVPPPEQNTADSSVARAADPEPRVSEDESEDHRRFSSSPKIPEIGRMSGFGLDMFAQQSNQPESVPSIPTGPILQHPGTSTQQFQPSLETIPSPIHNFDDSDSQTPIGSANPTQEHFMDSASLNNKSTSAGTFVPTSNSQQDEPHPPTSFLEESRFAQPHAPSTTPQARNLDVSDDDEVSPIVPSESTKALNPSGSGQTPQHLSSGLPTIHKTDFGNDPQLSQHAAAPLPAEDELPQPSRPFVDREQSFRPQLPGGWNSYATSTSENPSQHASEAEIHAASVAPVSPVSESEDDVEMTPTTARKFSHGSALGGVIGTKSTRGQAGAEDDHSLSSIEPAGTQDFMTHAQSNSQLPTPDPALAPSGNIYSAHHTDPRLQASLATGGNLEVPRSVSDNVSAASSALPTPPPKDTPNEGSQPPTAGTEYFPSRPENELKVHDPTTAASIAQPKQPSFLPSLNTATPLDDNDRLQEDIVKSLSPKPLDRGVGGGSLSIPSDAASGDPGMRESTYLPSEYDSYWDEPEQRDSQHPGREVSNASRPEDPTIINTQASPDTEAPPIPALSSKRRSMENRPPVLENRFSWDVGAEQEAMSPVPAPLNISRPGTGQGNTPDLQLRNLGDTSTAYMEHDDEKEHLDAPPPNDAILSSAGSKNVTSPASLKDEDSVSEASSTHSDLEKSAAIATGGLAAGAATAAFYSHHHDHPVEAQSERRLSYPDEKSPVHTSPYGANQTPTEEERLAPSSAPLVSPVSASSGPPIIPSIDTRNLGGASLPPAAPQKIMLFRDILKVDNQQARVRAYNDTRSQFRDMDTGLSQWLAFIGDQHRQLGEPSPSFVPSAKPGFPKSPGSAPSSPALQQPYYQQYLNASPTTSRPTTAGMTPAVPVGTQQGFSAGPSAGSKLSGQQVQAKSKELLHSAGVLGGKASKASKGLFNKGKNKLRGKDGDKDTYLDDSPPFKPTKIKSKDGRRASWGISSLTLARSSKNADSSSQHSREQFATQHSRDSTPVGYGPGAVDRSEHFRRPSIPLQSDFSRNTPDNAETSIWDRPVSAVSTPSIRHSMPAQIPSQTALGNGSLQPQPFNTSYAHSNGSATRNEDYPEEERDTLGVPAPIGKNQPSWDPFNATPIAEEEGPLFDRPLSVVAPAVQPPGPAGLSVPETHHPRDTASERSDSGETAYLSARERHSEATERPSETDDWVMVAKDESGPTSAAQPTPIPKSVPAIAPGVAVDNVASPGREMMNEVARSTVIAQAQSPPQATGTRPPGEAVVEVQEIETPSGDFPASRGEPSRERFVPQSVLALQNKDISHVQAANSRILSGRLPTDDEEYAPPPGPPPGYLARQAQEQAAAQPQIESNLSQAVPQTSPKPIYEQSRAERYSSSPAFSPPISPPAAAEAGPSASAQVPRDSYSSQPPSQQYQAPVQKYQQPAQRQQATAQQQSVNDETSQEGFVGLPPIRRSSTFGLGFGKKEKQRFALDDEDDVPVPPVPSGGVSGAGMQQPHAPNNKRYSWVEEQRDEESRPDMLHQSSSNYDQSLASSDVSTVPASDVQSQSQTQGQYVTPTRPSQETWRPNPPAQRPSYEHQQRARNNSAPGQGYMITPGTAGVPAKNRPVSYQQAPVSYQQGPKSYDQPPSSAQRYPDLFRPEQLGTENGRSRNPIEPPAHHYQAPLSREEAFLPRHSTNEYQLPGVGPPEDIPNGGQNPRRNSGLLKDFGRRLSRESSRTRNGGSKHDRDLFDDEKDDIDWNGRGPGRVLESRNTNISAPSIVSVDTTDGEKKKKRNSFFGSVTRVSTGGLASRESMVPNVSRAKTDLPAANGPVQTNPLENSEKKRSFFGRPKQVKDDPIQTTPNKLARASTGLATDSAGKKKRFSGLSSVFGGRTSMDIDRSRPGSSSPQVGPPGPPVQQSHQFPQGTGPPGGPDPQGRQVLQYAQGPPGGPDPRGRQYLESQMPQGQQPTNAQLSQAGPDQAPLGPSHMARQGPAPAIQSWNPLQTQGGPNLMAQSQSASRQGPDNRSAMTQSTSQSAVQQAQGPQERKMSGPPLQQSQASGPVTQVSSNMNRQSGQGPVAQPPQASVQRSQPLPPAQGDRSAAQFPQPQTTVLQTNLPRPAQLTQGRQDPRGSQDYQRQVSSNSLSTQSSIQTPQPQQPNGQRGNVPLPGQSVGGAPQARQQPQQDLRIQDPLSQRRTQIAAQIQAPPVQYRSASNGVAQGQSTMNTTREQVLARMPPKQSQLSTEQIPRRGPSPLRGPSPSRGPSPLAGSPITAPTRSDSSQRKLTRTSPAEKGKAKETSASAGGNRSSASRLFGGLLGKRTSTDKLNKASEKPQVAAPQQFQQPPPQQPQQQPLQQRNSQAAPYQQPQQAPRQVSQQGSGFQQDSGFPSWESRPQQQVQQDRGRQLQREPQYEQPPIPGGYDLVRGDGNMLSPTNYNPRGPHYSQQYFPQGGDQRMYQQQYYQGQGNPQQPGHANQGPYGQQYQQAPGPPQFVTQHPNLSQGKRSSEDRLEARERFARPLSKEDLLARSPARQQFGQQAPYQLTLPDHDSDGEEDVTPPRKWKAGQQSRGVAPSPASANSVNRANAQAPAPAPTKISAERNFAAAGPINTNISGVQHGSNDSSMQQPSLRHPMSPATYPLPEDTMFSPINPSASQIPPPPPPKNWPLAQSPNGAASRQPQASEQNRGLDRSNTNHTHASDISQLSGPRNDSLSVPGSQDNGATAPGRVEQGSPQITHQVSPEQSPEARLENLSPTPQGRSGHAQPAMKQVARQPVEEENIYDASPPPTARMPLTNKSAAGPSHAVQQNQAAQGAHPQQRIDTTNIERPGTASAQEKQLVESPDQRGRRRAEQEEKILVNETHPTALEREEEEGRATMSATSYPGQEWNPYGNYADGWDD